MSSRYPWHVTQTLTTKTRNRLLAICLSLSLIAGLAVAAAPAIQVGDVRTPKEKGDWVGHHFRKTVYESVAGLDTAKVKGGPFLVSASLVRLSAEDGDYGIQATAVVETVLRHKGSGALIGMTSGRATAAAPGGNLSDAQQSALRAAMDSALKTLPDALASR